MLIRFVVSNFLSFGEEMEFNMLAASYKTHKEHVKNLGKVNLLKTAAIYGANGAGKSNLIKAIDFFQKIVKEKKLNKSVNEVKFKLAPANIGLPVSFEIEFFTNDKIFSYGMNLQNNVVTEEWLYESKVNSQDKLIFERRQTKSGKSNIKMAPKFLASNKSKLLIKLMQDNLLAKNELLLAKNDSLKIPEIGHAFNWILKGLVIIFPHSKFAGLTYLAISNKFKNFLNKTLLTFDTGVNNLDTKFIELDKYYGENNQENEEKKKDLIQKVDNATHNIVRIHDDGETILALKHKSGKYLILKVVSYHKNSKGKSVMFEIKEESDGTQRLLDIIPAIDMILHEDKCVIVDEIDQSLHPSLLKLLIQKILNDKKIKGQFIFSTHESNLLDLNIFRQDEIWFTEKNKTGNTYLYSLNQFKPRYDLDIRKGYLQGRFGGIPFLANLEDLNWNKYV